MNDNRKNVLALFFLIITSMFFGQTSNKRIPFYALPWYNYEPLTIKVGKFSQELSTNDSAKLMLTAKKISNEIDSTNIESLYVLSIRLYDLGKKDDAFYWFHTAKARARVFMTLLDKDKIGSMGSAAFELKQLFGTFNQLIGEYMNGYGFNDIDKGLTTINKVKNELQKIKSYKSLYPKVQFLDDSNLESAKADKEKDMQQLVDYMTEHKEEVIKKRIESGIQDKY